MGLAWRDVRAASELALNVEVAVPAGAIENEVRSPMPGTVITVNVQVGDEVEQGEALLIVEAMKMEYTLVAPRSGRIGQVRAGVGDRVLVDAPLVDLEPVSVTT